MLNNADGAVRAGYGEASSEANIVSRKGQVSTETVYRDKAGSVDRAIVSAICRLVYDQVGVYKVNEAGNRSSLLLKSVDRDSRGQILEPDVALVRNQGRENTGGSGEVDQERTRTVLDQVAIGEVQEINQANGGVGIGDNRALVGEVELGGAEVCERVVGGAGEGDVARKVGISRCI